MATLALKQTVNGSLRKDRLRGDGYRLEKLDVGYRIVTDSGEEIDVRLPLGRAHHVARAWLLLCDGPDAPARSLTPLQQLELAERVGLATARATREGRTAGEIRTCLDAQLGVDVAQRLDHLLT